MHGVCVCGSSYMYVDERVCGHVGVGVCVGRHIGVCVGL